MDSPAFGMPIPGDDSHVEQSILVVCAANVCRSPLMELALQQALTELAPQRTWRVRSAGASARPGQRMCEQAATFAVSYPEGQRLATSHRSRTLDLSMVQQAGLILVASHQQRSAVTALDPAARRRTFTLREATMMVRRVASRWGSALPPTTSETHLLPTLVDLLHSQRGTLAISSGPPHASSRRGHSSQQSLDIADVHERRGRRHKPVFSAIAEDSADLASGLARVCVLPAQPSHRQLG